MSDRTRVTLIDKLKTGQNEKAWSEFYANYSGYLAAIIRNLNVDDGDIDDLLQKVMVTSWEKIPDLDYDPNKGRFRSWLAQIARNTVMNHYTSTMRRAARMKQLADEPGEDPDERIQAMAEKEWRIHVAKLAWESIRGNYEENAVKAFDLISEGKANKEVAEELGIKPNTVAVYKKRIIEALRKEIRRLDAYLA